MSDFYQTLSNLNLTNFTINGEPALLYGMIGATTLLLSYVTFMKGSEGKGKGEPEPEPKGDEPDMMPSMGMMPLPLETE
ncbi:MAG: hypothetical protein EBV19_08675, partial [Flavobacteriia bacterium]|nr:hypothetical protein [Flavobacteriia bacterium]